MNKTVCQKLPVVVEATWIRLRMCWLTAGSMTSLELAPGSLFVWSSGWLP